MRALIYPIIAFSFILLSSCEEAQEKNNEVFKQKVELVKIKEQPFYHEIRVQGNIETDEDVLITAEMAGQLTLINVHEGDKVTKGQILATIDASIIASNLQELETQLEYAEYVLDKQQKLLDNGVGTPFEVEAAKNRVNSIKASMNSVSTQKGKAAVKAPFSGTIDQVFAKEGQIAGPTAPLFRLVNNGTIHITSSISEKHFSNVKKGTKISVEFPNYSDTTLTTTIDHVGNYIDPVNRTFRIKSTIKNNDFFLPNMLAEVRIKDLDVEKGIVVPSESILKDQNNIDFVFVAEEVKEKKSKSKSKSKSEEKSKEESKSKGERESESESKEDDRAIEYQVRKVVVEVIEKFEGKALIHGTNIKSGNLVVVKGARGISDLEIVRTK